MHALRGPRGDRKVFEGRAADPPATPRRLGDVRFLCHRCSSIVAVNLPLRGLMELVFRCADCGAESELPRVVPSPRA